MTGTGGRRGFRTVRLARVPLPGGCHRYVVHVDGTVVGRVESARRAKPTGAGTVRWSEAKVWTAYDRAGVSVGSDRETRAAAVDDLLARTGGGTR